MIYTHTYLNYLISEALPYNMMLFIYYYSNNTKKKTFFLVNVESSSPKIKKQEDTSIEYEEDKNVENVEENIESAGVTREINENQ